jgi:hypothetical protein
MADDADHVLFTRPNPPSAGNYCPRLGSWLRDRIKPFKQYRILSVQAHGYSKSRQDAVGSQAL